ncbi:hypothetical protein XENTR_v10015630 [Xenopus tropicalis]|nr:hypothetical protein XENTR_v10015630 [Xenopus tropicalis]
MHFSLPLLGRATGRVTHSPAMEPQLFLTEIKEEPDSDLSPMGSSAAPPTDGVSPAAEPDIFQVNKKEEEPDYDYSQNPMENSAVPLTDGENCPTNEWNCGILPVVGTKTYFVILDTAKEPLASPGMLLWPPETRAQTTLDCRLSASSVGFPAGPKAAGFICDKCGLSFSAGVALLSHCCNRTMINRQSRRLQQLSAPVCMGDWKQKSSGNASRAHQLIYTEEKCLPCPQCGRLFPEGYRMRNHMLIHNGEKPFICTECGKAFKRRVALVEHERVHTGERPYRCQQCGRSYTHRGSLYSHQAACYEEKPFACTECGKRFSQKSLYLLHQNSHTPPCADCGKTFTRKYSYQQHIKTHRKERKGANRTLTELLP